MAHVVGAGLRVRGVVYDVGVVPFPGRESRPVFDAAAVERDMRVIAADLHCTAVRIIGRDLERLEVAARCAQRHGLAVWLSPLRHDATGAELLSALGEAAQLAERLRAGGEVVLVVGWELTMFMRGMVTGAGVAQRARTFSSRWRLVLSTLRRGSFNARLNAFLRRACATAREHFSGPITYAAGMWEQVDWSRFDYVAIDAYRDASTRDGFPRTVAAWARHGKPVIASEFGCATYRGARDRGALAWAVVDRSTTPPRLDGLYERSEAEQAREISEVLDVLVEGGVEGAFVFTFASCTYPRGPEPSVDLDMAAYGIVASRSDGTWEAKEAFTTVAERYQN